MRHFVRDEVFRILVDGRARVENNLHVIERDESGVLHAAVKRVRNRYLCERIPRVRKARPLDVKFQHRGGGLVCTLHVYDGIARIVI